MTRDGPEYGPRGYLPERAARRARKIILREQMGLGWPLAALLAMVLVVAAGLAYLAVGRDAPGPPFVPVARLADVPPGTAERITTVGGDVLLLRAAGAVRAYRAPQTAVRWCAEARRLEGANGQVWTRNGALAGGAGTGLPMLPLRIHDGTVYVDPSSPGPVPAPVGGGQRPTC